ncbi:hypothetical protein [Tenacibaculum geojense]|uniref:Lipoprotein n=1 Tax=Tenacibaculum geojense TaxID=915352 RepID=A0ABW3JRW6_9FLAO
MKKIFSLLIIASFLGCSEKNNDIFITNKLEDRLLVFQRNTDSNTSDFYTKVYEADAATGKILNELGGYPRIQARTYYDLVYYNDEILTKRSTGELIRFNLDSNTQTITDFNQDVYNLMVLDGRLFGTKYNTSSIDLVEIDELGNVISVIDTYEELPDSPSNNRTGMYRITFSPEENLLIVSRRLSFLSDAIDKLYLYNVKTGSKKEVDINNYQSIISGNSGRIYALKTVDTPNSLYSKLIEFNKETGEELRDVYIFDDYLSDSDELVFFSSLNQILVIRGYESMEKVDVNSGKLITTPIDYDYSFLGGLRMTR